MGIFKKKAQEGFKQTGLLKGYGMAELSNTVKEMGPGPCDQCGVTPKKGRPPHNRKCPKVAHIKTGKKTGKFIRYR